MSTMTQEALVRTSLQPPTVFDKCDKCRVAEALVRVAFKKGFQLLFCGHHFDDQMKTLAFVEAVAEYRDIRPHRN